MKNIYNNSNANGNGVEMWHKWEKWEGLEIENGEIKNGPPLKSISLLSNGQLHKAGWKPCWHAPKDKVKPQPHLAPVAQHLKQPQQSRQLAVNGGRVSPQID
ncbi:hypothetical protein ACLKA7_010448 [Drosophila subpalustris]